jgi:hypothetical protein
MNREVLKLALEALEDLIEAGAEDWSEQRPCVRIGREVATEIREALAKQEAESHLQAVSDFGQLQEQEPVAWPSRRAVERAIESVENPKGMHLNDGKERVTLPGGTLRYMLALIDRTSPPKRQPDDFDSWYASPYAKVLMKSIEEDYSPKRQPLTDGEIADLYFDNFSMGELTAFARAIEAAHGIGVKT